MLPEKHIEILHDHHKDTFQRIRDIEQTRDRLFLWMIGLFVLLFIEIVYPTQFTETVDSASTAIGEIDVSRLPLDAIVTATWILTLWTALRYCQNITLIERQYTYLHSLEDVIADDINIEPIYRRESKVYLDQYPSILDMAWYFYIYFIPITLILATIQLLSLMWKSNDDISPHRILNTIIGVLIVCLLFVHRITAQISRN